MALWTRSAVGTDTPISTVWDTNAAGTLYRHQTWWDRDTVPTDRVVYQNEMYLVQNNRALVPWNASVGVANSGQEGPSGAGKFLWSQANFGLQGIFAAVADGNHYGLSISTLNAYDLTPYNYITFAFDNWARDASNTGYYRTYAGVYSNRICGSNGPDTIPQRPASMLAGWICTDITTGVRTLNISNVNRAAYIGMSSTGGPGGNGSVWVSYIRLHN